MSELKIVPWAPMYLADEEGGIWSRHRARGFPTGSPPHRLHPKINPDGYGCLTICVGGKRHDYFVHVLVLEAFVGPRPYPKAEACHRDGDPANCRVDNLYWGSHAQNVADRDRHGRTKRGEQCANAKLTDAIVRDIKRALANGASTDDIFRNYKVNRGTISFIRRGLQWAHIQ